MKKPKGEKYQKKRERLKRGRKLKRKGGGNSAISLSLETKKFEKTVG